MVLTWVVTPCSPACGSTSMLFSSWVGNMAAAPTHVVTRQHETRMRVVERIGLQQQRQQSSAAAAFSAAPAPTGAATCHDDERGVPGEVVQAFPTSRGSVLRRVTSALAVGSIAFGIGASPGAALDPQRDARTALPPPPALLLPVMKVRAATTKVLELLGDPSRWEEARSLLSSPPLSPTDFATILDRYSDSNWGKHILGDLYRNQGLASIKALDEVMAFALQQQANGVAVVQDDIDDVREAGRALADSLDDFLALAPPEDLRMVKIIITESSQ